MNIGWFGRRKHGADAFAQEEQHLGSRTIPHSSGVTAAGSRSDGSESLQCRNSARLYYDLASFPVARSTWRQNWSAPLTNCLTRLKVWGKDAKGVAIASWNVQCWRTNRDRVTEIWDTSGLQGKLSSLNRCRTCHVTDEIVGNTRLAGGLRLDWNDLDS